MELAAYNYGSPFLENDPLTGRAESGAVSGSRNNANMGTGADGRPDDEHVPVAAAGGRVLPALRGR